MVFVAPVPKNSDVNVICVFFGDKFQHNYTNVIGFDIPYVFSY